MDGSSVGGRDDMVPFPFEGGNGFADVDHDRMLVTSTLQRLDEVIEPGDRPEEQVGLDLFLFLEFFGW